MELFIPSTFAVDERDDKMRVQRIGNLARAAAIFGVETITIYKDKDRADEERNAELIEKHLVYAECPPYLRKALIPKDPDLKYAGILPPLQILSHGYSQDFREGVVTRSEDDTTVVDIGLAKPAIIDASVSEGTRVTVMKTDGDWEAIDYKDIEGFWTYEVQNQRKPLGELLPEDRPVIGTSAKGDPLHVFVQDYEKHGYGYTDSKPAVVFGSAWRGIPELIERGDCNRDQFNGIYDFVPSQHTKTVRTSEAIPVVLGIINAVPELR